MNAPAIDIVIAARNEETHLPSCLQALNQQEYPNLKVYVVNDRSVDATAEIAAAHGAIVLTTDAPGGISAARNLALRRCQGDYIGFLDAHCIVSKEWVHLMVSRLSSEEDIGGCQGSFDYRCVSPNAGELLKHTQFASDRTLWEHTVSGNRSAFPWAVTGNSMYRRSAIEHAGHFDEQIHRCEDTDLSWRVVWCGYRLEFVPEARVIHVDENSWFDFMVKHFRYGAGSAQLAYAYNLHGQRTPSHGKDKDLQSLVLGWMYRSGYWLKELRLRLGIDPKPVLREFKGVKLAAQFRPPFRWTSEQTLQISEKILYWHVGSSSITTVQPSLGQRTSLEGTAFSIFRCLRRGHSRQEVLSMLASEYSVTADKIADDLDDLIESLLESQILLRTLPPA